MKNSLALIIILISVLAIPPAYAEIESYDIDFRISLGNAYTTQKIEFAERDNITIRMPEDAADVYVSVNGEKKDVSEIKKNLTLNGKNFEIRYLTKKFIDENNFVADFTYPDDIKNLRISLTLSSNLELARPVEEGTLVSNSVFPKADAITSDGQRIKVMWTRNDVDKGNSISMLVKFRERKDFSFLVYALIIIIVAVSAAVFIIIRKKQSKVKTVVKTRKAKLEEHLKEEEGQIVRILKSRGRQCEQGTLRIVTGFSKAKLSGLLKELEDRNVIYKEKRGKKNLVFLKE